MASRQSANRIRCAYLNEIALLQGDWDDLGHRACEGFHNVFSAYLQPDLVDEADLWTITDVQPHILSAISAKNDPDAPTFNQAINSSNAEQWWDAMEVEMNTLEVDLAAWQLVRREPWMNVLCSKWAFRVKRFPNGLVKKFKARFCVRGDMQIEGVDFFETWAPVVSWPTVHAMMILATKLNLVSVQADITAAFVHAELDEDEHIYVHQAAGFKRDGNLVYKLRRSVYGLRQSPRNFFQYLSSKMQDAGLRPSKLDPCLFVGDRVIAVIYVDDVLLYSKSACDR